MALERVSGPARMVAPVVACTAFCVLAYEIALTRIFSVLFRSPLVFLILSIAVCGLGLGSFLAARGNADDREDALAAPALAFAVLLALPLVLLLTVGRSLVAGAHGVGVALLTSLPYLAAGLLLSRVFRRYPEQAGRLYFCDLAGAALAALAAAKALSVLGGLTLPLALGCLAALAAWFLAWPLGQGWRLGGAGVFGALLVLCAFQVDYRLLDLPPTHVDPDDPRAPWVKPLFQELGDPRQGARIHYTEWSPVARTDVVSNAGVDTLYIWTDGDVPTQMEPFDGDLRRAAGYRRFIGYVPFALQPEPERVLCIGPGGGLDVLLAILGGAKQIEPVELNPAIVSVTERFKGFYGDLYHRPEVTGLVIDEGRSYLSRSSRRYDVIYFALAKSATTQQGGLALVDNYLYTVEAFREYVSHLSEQGLVALVLQQRHLTERCFVTAVEAMRQSGLSGSEIADRVAFMGLPPERQFGPYQHLLLIRATPFAEPQRQQLIALAEERGLVPLFVPGKVEPAPYSVLRTDPAGFARAVAGQDIYVQRLYRGGPWVRLNLSAVTDDRPFYADLSPGLNPFVAGLLRASVVAGLLTMVLAGIGAHRVAPCPRADLTAGIVGYFACLGLGFLLVEVALIQKLVLLLGYPTLSLTVILFALLIGSSAGSWYAGTRSELQAARRLPIVIVVLALALVAARYAVGPMTSALLPSPLPVRVAATVALVGGLGFLMGQPFPTGLRMLRGPWRRLVPYAWAVNGVLSVTGSVVAAAAASLWGYSAVLLTGAGVYVAAGGGARWMWRLTSLVETATEADAR